MATELVPLSGGLWTAGLIQTALALSKLRLCTTGLNVSPNTTLAECVALEATFSGYTAGGYSLTTWNAPVFDPAGGASIQSLQVQPAQSATTVTNILGSWFLVDATGVLIAVGNFDSPIPMAVVGDGFPITVKLWFGTTNQLAGATVYGGGQ
jgi:hypothetical protein